MSRYMGWFVLDAQARNLLPVLVETLQECDLNVVYRSDDYLMARESPGAVPLSRFSRLVTAEILVERVSNQQVRLQVVAKNEELPLHQRNHCQQVFEKISAAISSNQNWELLELVAG
ncbi:MAG: hypothetical protein Q6K12_06080 [Gloeomargarita sp. DG_1_6_bins_138]